jgi:hypothetical protein
MVRGEINSIIFILHLALWWTNQWVCDGLDMQYAWECWKLRIIFVIRFEIKELLDRTKHRREQDFGMWTGLNWPSLLSCGRLLWHGNSCSGSIKQGILYVAAEVRNYKKVTNLLTPWRQNPEDNHTGKWWTLRTACYGENRVCHC